MALMPNNNKYPEEVFCTALEPWGRIHEWGITYVGLISRPDNTELELGPSENAYRARQMSVITTMIELNVSNPYRPGCVCTHVATFQALHNKHFL